MLDQLKNKAEEFINKPEVKDAIGKAKEKVSEIADSEKGKKIVDDMKDKVEGLFHKK